MSREIDFSNLDRIVQSALRHGAFTACCILVGQENRVLYRKAFGQLSIEEDAPVTSEQTRFDLGSLTKPLVVGMLALRALEEGCWQLSDRLDDFMDAPPDKAGITIRQLLTHTAGLGATHLWEKPGSAQNSGLAILNTPLLYAPGQNMRYTCSGYILLGQLLECLYQQPLDRLASQMVFERLNMRKTGYCPQEGNIAATEMQDDGRCLQGVVHDENARELGGVAGNSGVFSDMDDLALWMQMLCCGGHLPDQTKYLSRPSLHLAMEPMAGTEIESRSLIFRLQDKQPNFMGDYFPRGSIGHTGFPGTSVVLSPEDGLYVVLLTNRICPSRDSSEIKRFRCLVHNAVYAAVCG